MVIKEKGLRVDKKGHIQLDRRCKEHYYQDQPERSKREDVRYENFLDYELGLHERFNDIEKDIHRERCGALNTTVTP